MRVEATIPFRWQSARSRSEEVVAKNRPGIARGAVTGTGLSRSTIYRKIAEGTFPAQIKISTNGAGWKESDINRWVANPVGWRQRSFNEFDFLDDF